MPELQGRSLNMHKKLFRRLTTSYSRSLTQTENCVLFSASCCYQTPRIKRTEKTRVTSRIWQRRKQTLGNIRHHLEGAISQSTLPCTGVVGREGLLRFSHVRFVHTRGSTYTCHRSFHGGYSNVAAVIIHRHASAYHAQGTPLVGTGRCSTVPARYLESPDRFPTAPLQGMHCMHCTMPLAWKEEQQRLCCHA